MKCDTGLKWVKMFQRHPRFDLIILNLKPRLTQTILYGTL